jgi:hypothetical protein
MDLIRHPFILNYLFAITEIKVFQTNFPINHYVKMLIIVGTEYGIKEVAIKHLHIWLPLYLIENLAPIN